MNCRIRFHPLVERDLEAITEWIIDYAGVDEATQKLSEIDEAIEGLAAIPYRASRRDEILPGLRVIPAGRMAAVAFTIDETAGEVLIQAVTYGGADWASQSRNRTP